MPNIRDISRYTRPRYIESPKSTEIFVGVLKTPELSIDTNNKLRLSWSNIDEDTQSYDLEYSFNNSSWAIYDNPTKDKITYDLSDDLADGTYKFRIRAKAGITDQNFGYHEFFSAWSNETTPFTVKTLSKCKIESIGEETKYYFSNVDSDTDFIILTITKNNSTTTNVRFEKADIPTVDNPYIISYTDVGTYVLSAVSYNENEYLFHNNASSNTETLKVIKLATPILTDENFTQETPIVNWTAIENANAYRIYLNNNVINQSYSGGLSYNFENNIDPNIDNYSAKIQAIKSGQTEYPKIKYLDSDISNEIIFGYLPTPVLVLNTEVGMDNQIIIQNFDKFENASEFEVYNIEQGIPKLLITIPAVESTYLLISRVPKTFNIQMKAVSNSDHIVNSELSNVITYSFTKLNTPTIEIEGNAESESVIVRWNSILNAQYYEIYVNNQKRYTTESTSYSVNLITGNNNIYIIAKSNYQRYLDSDISNVKIIKKDLKSSCQVIINGEEVPIVLPFTFHTTLDESMDTGIAVTVPINRKDPFEAFSSVVVNIGDEYIAEDGGTKISNKYKFPKYMILAFDDVEEIQLGDKSLFKHNLNLIERTKLLETELMPDFSITQPMDYTQKKFEAGKEVAYPSYGNNFLFTNSGKHVCTGDYWIIIELFGTRHNFLSLYGLENESIKGNLENYYPINTKIPLPYESATEFTIEEQPTWTFGSNFAPIYFNSINDLGIKLKRTYKYRTHSNLYDVDPDHPETNIYTYEDNAQHTWDTTNITPGDYDIILEVYIDEFDWQKLKSKLHYEGNGRLEFMYDKNADIKLTTEFNGEKTDFSKFRRFRIVWGLETGGITLSRIPSSTEQKKVPWNGKSVYDAINKALRILTPLKYGNKPKYQLSPVHDNLKAIDCPELKFQGGKSLYEVLTTLGRLFYGIPRLGCYDSDNVYHNNWITFDILDNRTIKELQKSSFIDSDNLETMSSTIENHSTGYVSNISNMITKEYYETYPAGDLWISPRSGAETDPLANKDNMSIVLDKPIYRLVSVLVSNFDDSGSIIDIKDYVEEESIFQSLNNDADGKGLSIYYKQGDNKILGLGNIPQASESQAAWGLTPDDYIIQRILFAKGIGISKQKNPNEFKYKVIYVPYVDARVYTEQTNIAGLENTSYKNLNQEDNVIYDYSFGKSAQTQVERLGNNSISKEYKTIDSIILPELGQIKDFEGYHYYADDITYVYSNNFVSCKANFSKNFNKINERVGIDAEYRLFRIYANDFIDRSININRYCYLSLNKYNNKYDSFNDVNNNFIKNFKKSLNNGSNKCAPEPKPDVFYIRNFKNESDPLQYNAYDNGELTQVPCSLLSANYNTFNNSIMLSGKFIDNYSAGVQASKDYNKQKVQKDVRYVDTNGENQVMGITLCNLTKDMIYKDTSGRLDSDMYPEAPYSSSPNLFHNAIFSEKIDLNKDNKECINIVYQMHFQTFDKNLTIHRPLINDIYYDKNIIDYSDPNNQIDSPKYILYKGDISKQDKTDIKPITNYIQLSSDISEGSFYIDSITLENVNDNYNGYALVKQNGEILYSYNIKIDKGTNFTIPKLYFNFNDNKQEYHNG